MFVIAVAIDIAVSIANDVNAALHPIFTNVHRIRKFNKRIGAAADAASPANSDDAADAAGNAAFQANAAVMSFINAADVASCNVLTLVLFLFLTCLIQLQ